MATLQQIIQDQFLATLAESKRIDAAKIERLRGLLGTGKKLKADDFEKVFAEPTGEDVK